MRAQNRFLLVAGPCMSIWWEENIVDVVLLIVTIISVICAFLAYAFQKNKAKKETACRLAKYYAKDILPKLALIFGVLKTDKIDLYIKETVDLTKIKRFTMSELEDMLRIVSISPGDFFKKIFEVHSKSILNAKIALSEDKREVIRQYTNGIENGEVKMIDIALKDDFENEVPSILNDLEWFSMNCQYGVADEKLLFQSLHQSFLSAVWLLYPKICLVNQDDPEDKFYTNIIWLFNLWESRIENMKKKREKKGKKAEKRVRLAKERQEKIANAENIYTGKKL